MSSVLDERLTLALGIAPGTHSSMDEVRIMDQMARNATLKPLLQLWVTKQGIPDKSAKTALPKSLVTAYIVPNYLKGWRNKTNPSWALLSDDIDADTDVDYEPPAAPTIASPPDPTTEAPVAAQDSVQTKLWLEALFKQIDLTVNSLVATKLANTTLKLSDSDKDQIKTLARVAAKQQVEDMAPPRQIEIVDRVAGTVTNVGLQHERFPILLRAMQARDHRGFRLNVWLTGPTGSGKTSACENAAKALSLKFGSDGSLDADYKVLGFRDANGNIVSTQFLDIYENGGIYVADEIDNWMPSALLSLNAALANGWVSSPRGMIQRHKDVCVIACANTWGYGATGDYVGRTRLDAASLDRFQPKIDWPYDERMEQAIADGMDGNIGIDWCHTVQNARKAVTTQGLKIIISPRTTFNGIALLQSGFDREEVIAMTFAAGISAEQKKALSIRPVVPIKRSEEGAVTLDTEPYIPRLKTAKSYI